MSITGVCGVAAAVTGGRFGFFRPDLSFNAMTDIFGVVATTLIVWLMFDFPPGAEQEVGVYLALAGALTIATGAGDFKIKSLFPRVPAPRGSPELWASPAPGEPNGESGRIALPQAANGRRPQRRRGI